MATILKIKEGHLTDFTATIKDGDGDALDLSEYDSVDFIMVDQNETVITNSPATFTDKTNGEVTYNFTADDVSNSGQFKAYFSLKTGGIKKLASPTDYFIINITRDYL
jgi:hypothetical protein